MSTKDTENLEFFFQVTMDIFERILEDADWFLDSEMQGLANEAWKELQPDFEILRSAVTGPDGKKLEQVGLSGNQLKFKMHVFNVISKEIISKKVVVSKKVLGAINSILGSLASIISFSMAEPIKEFKDFLELVKQE